MQPMYRPPMPSQGMRPPGAPPPGSLPSGLPPPQRPPAGYRPSFPMGNPPPGAPPSAPPGAPPGAPPFGLMGNPLMAPPTMKSSFNPPVQKMAAMNLDPSCSQQCMSNGVPDINNSISKSTANGDQSTNNPAYSNAQISEPPLKSYSESASAGSAVSTSSDSLQHRFQRDSPQGESFPSSQSPSLSQRPPSTPEMNNSSPSLPSMNTNFVPPRSLPSSNSSGLGTSTGPLDNSFMAPPQLSRAPTNTIYSSAAGNMSMPMAPSQSGMPSTSPQMMPPQPSMQPPKSSIPLPDLHMGSPRSGMPPSSSHMGSSVPGMPPSSSHMGSSVPGMPPSSSHMGPSVPGMPPSSSHMGPSVPGMPPSSSHMGPSVPGMPPSSSHMGPSVPGMPPSSSHMGPSVPGMPPSSSHMGPSVPGMPPSSTHMGPSVPGMPPSSTHMGPSVPGMPPSSTHMGPSIPVMPPSSTHMGPSVPGMSPTNSYTRPPFPGMPNTSSQMGTPRPGMSLSGSFMGPTGSAMPPPSTSSHMMPPQPGMQPPRPGMPPPPTSSYMASPGTAIPPPPTSSHMGPGAPPGMPPSPSSMNQPSPSAMGGMQNRYPGAGPVGGYTQGSQGRRLNPDDMPSPLQVMDEDRQCKSGELFTNMKGCVPPLVTTDFVVKDGGNASPRFIRSTMYSIPATQDMMKQASVPFGLVISPLADLQHDEAPLYQGTSLANGPVRCNRCKAYMSPYMMFMDGGRRYQCLFCKQINEVPADYYCHMDSQGARADKYQRPELCLGSYEFIATPEYCKDKLLPKEPAFIFVFEMSQMMVQRGIINLLCQNMKSLLEHLPKDEIPGQKITKSSIRVGFITYDSSVHFYKLTGLAPEMCILCDKENMFVPVPDGVLCDIEEVVANIDKLMESIPQNFQTTRETSGTLSCAIQAGMAALKASGRAGKLFVFHSSLPQIEGLGKLKNREDRKLLGTDKEKSILSPQTTHYNNLAQDLVTVGCGVDLYIFNESYIDLATIGQVTRLTGGQCYKYTFFQPNKDGERLLDDLRININRNIAFESVMRVRTSTGVRPVDFFGHFFMSNTHDIELSVVDSSKAVAVEIKHDDKITEEDGVYIQIALLYTSVGGQRRLRIFNLALTICTQMADLYKNCELDTLMNFFGKQSMFKFLETTAKQVKENFIARTAQILACYRKNCASPSSAGQLILPELMKLLPLYVNCLTKCDALSGGQDLTCDDRSWHMYQLTTMPVEASVVYYYPRLIPLSDIDPQDVDIPPAVRTSYEKLSPDGVYLLENGLFMFMWVGSGTSSTWMKEVFGVSAPHQLDPVLAELPELDNPISKRVRGIIEAVREQRKLHVRLFVVPQQGKHEVVMRNYLVEDKGVFGAPSYVDFLCHVHKEIRVLLS